MIGCTKIHLTPSIIEHNDMNAEYFVGIGAAKSGTSWLASYLDEHPQVAMSPIKELHYFDALYCPEISGRWNENWRNIHNELTARQAKAPKDRRAEKLRCVGARLDMIDNPEAYRQYFDALLQEQHKVFGEITPAYSILPARGYAAIQKIYPGAKFIFMMRDPLQRYLSHIRFIQQLRATQGKDLLEDFDTNAQAIEKLSDPEYTRRADYQGTIETLLQTTGEEKLCVLFYEHLFSNEKHEHELRQLSDFLGIRLGNADLETKVNASLEADFDTAVQRRIWEHFASTYEFIGNKYGASAPASWHWQAPC